MAALAAGQEVRSARLAPARQDVVIKGDGSPVTMIEAAIESRLRALLASFDPLAAFVGEESGGTIPETGLAMVVDPIDGTWGFVTGTESIATSIALFHDGRPILGVVANASTGEVGYAGDRVSGRLLQMGLFGVDDSAVDLPLHDDESDSILVDALYEEWSAHRIRMVRSPGGSPAWALLEAARGRYSYVNLWSKRPAEEFDLVAGVTIVRAAGGRVAGLDGELLDGLEHSGPFVASRDSSAVHHLLDLIRRVRATQDPQA
jgi:fructose-1,6-bisphosphatase/inositol monophosphatase family enzyme